MLVTDDNDYPRAYWDHWSIRYIIPHAGAHPVWVYARHVDHTTFHVHGLSSRYLTETEVRTKLMYGACWLERVALPEAIRQKFEDWYRSNHASH